MHYHGGALHWMSAFHPFCSEWCYAVFFSVLQYASDIMVTHHMHLTISTPFLSSEKVTIGFLVGKHLLNLFSLFGECVHIHCFDFSSV
jgi:hypothetical protein